MVAQPLAAIDHRSVLSREIVRSLCDSFDGDVEAVAPLLPDYLKRFRASARIRGLTFDSSGNIEDSEKLREAAREVVMVKISMRNPRA